MPLEVPPAAIIAKSVSSSSPLREVQFEGRSIFILAQAGQAQQESLSKQSPTPRKSLTLSVLPQDHGRVEMFKAREKHTAAINQAFNSQYEIGEFIRTNSSLPVIAEGIHRQITRTEILQAAKPLEELITPTSEASYVAALNNIKSNPTLPFDQEFVRNLALQYILTRLHFPQGWPTSKDAFTPAQRDSLVLHGAAEIMFFLGVVQDIFPASSEKLGQKVQAIQNELQSKMDPESAAAKMLTDVRIQRLIFEERESDNRNMIEKFRDSAANSNGHAIFINGKGHPARDVLTNLADVTIRIPDNFAEAYRDGENQRRDRNAELSQLEIREKMRFYLHAFYVSASLTIAAGLTAAFYFIRRKRSLEKLTKG